MEGGVRSSSPDERASSLIVAQDMQFSSPSSNMSGLNSSILSSQTRPIRIPEPVALQIARSPSLSTSSSSQSLDWRSHSTHNSPPREVQRDNPGYFSHEGNQGETDDEDGGDQTLPSDIVALADVLQKDVQVLRHQLTLRFTHLHGFIPGSDTEIMSMVHSLFFSRTSN
jgi:hypothetical protein